MAKVAGAMKKSTAVMQSMSKLVKAPEMALTMRKMGEEMRRAGIIDELVGDAMDDAMGGAELDEEADEVTERVIAELTAGIAGAAPSALKGGLPGAVRAPAAAAHAGAGAPARVALPEGADDAAAARLDKF
jgi:division protein CdvB (Snf7/Vps24/ESCRT-III family)